jgi:hypothetical protein
MELQKLEALNVKNRINTRQIKLLEQKELFNDLLKRTGKQRGKRISDPKNHPTLKKLQKDVEKTMRKIEDTKK